MDYKNIIINKKKLKLGPCPLKQLNDICVNTNGVKWVRISYHEHQFCLRLKHSQLIIYFWSSQTSKLMKIIVYVHVQEMCIPSLITLICLHNLSVGVKSVSQQCKGISSATFNWAMTYLWRKLKTLNLYFS